MKMGLEVFSWRISWYYWVMLGLAAAIIFLAALNINKDNLILKLKINKEQYEKKQERIEGELEVIAKASRQKDKRIKELEKELKNLPTDEEVIVRNPIRVVTVNDEWTVITSLIEQQLDSLK